MVLIKCEMGSGRTITVRLDNRHHIHDSISMFREALNILEEKKQEFYGEEVKALICVQKRITS